MTAPSFRHSQHDAERELRLFSQDPTRTGPRWLLVLDPENPPTTPSDKGYDERVYITYMALGTAFFKYPWDVHCDSSPKERPKGRNDHWNDKRWLVEHCWKSRFEGDKTAEDAFIEFVNSMKTASKRREQLGLDR